MYQNDPVRVTQQPLPTMYDLPSEDLEDSGLPDEFHDFQPQLLRETFRPSIYPPSAVFIGTDLNLYYDSRHTQWHKRPDGFAVLGVHSSAQVEEMRWSYVIWQEGIAPFLVVELLSPGTEAEDLGQTLREINQPPTKREVYEVSYECLTMYCSSEVRHSLGRFSSLEHVIKPWSCRTSSSG